MTAPRVLIATIAARTGGVPAMVRFAVGVLRDMGCTPVIAYYEPYSVNPKLSVPFFALGRRRPGSERVTDIAGCETHAIGAWLPELEATTYRPNAHWRRMIASCTAHIAVSGNALAALPYALGQVPSLAWIASDWSGDRVDRVRAFSPVRRLFDSALVRPLTARAELHALAHGNWLALSRHTAAELARLTGRAPPPVCPTPVDTAQFQPQPDATVVGDIVFSGRFGDPRKNLPLLLDAFALLRSRGRTYRLTLCGGERDPALEATLVARDIADAVRVPGYLNHSALARHLAEADVFALPSHQEGLCIAALEAMSCGLPIVSTRCGGPEEFVIPGSNGELVASTAVALADALDVIIRDRPRRARYAAAARATIEQQYSQVVAQTAFRRALQATFPALK